MGEGRTHFRVLMGSFNHQEVGVRPKSMGGQYKLQYLGFRVLRILWTGRAADGIR